MANGDELMATIERRERAQNHIINSLAHYSREDAMYLILGWFSIDDLHAIAPTLAGSPVPEETTDVQ